MLQKDLFDKLHMTDSSYFVPKNLTNAVMVSSDSVNPSVRH